MNYSNYILFRAIKVVTGKEAVLPCNNWFTQYVFWRQFKRRISKTLCPVKHAWLFLVLLWKVSWRSLHTIVVKDSFNKWFKYRSGVNIQSFMQAFSLLNTSFNIELASPNVSTYRIAWSNVFISHHRLGTIRRIHRFFRRSS